MVSLQVRTGDEGRRAGRTRRISVVGCAGAGKTTVAGRLSAVVGSTLVELDALHWGPNWSAATEAEMTGRVSRAIAGDDWVADGNYHSKIGTLVWDRADTVVWVDPPRWRVMMQVFRRSAVRGLTRRALWNGNREGLEGLMFWRGDRSIVRWAWDSHPRARTRYAAAMSDPRFSHLEFHRLRTRRDVDGLVRSLARTDRRMGEMRRDVWAGTGHRGRIRAGHNRRN